MSEPGHRTPTPSLRTKEVIDQDALQHYCSLQSNEWQPDDVSGRHPDVSLHDIDEVGDTDVVVVPQQSETPPPRVPSVALDTVANITEHRSASSLAIPTSKRVVYHRRERKKTHPLEESLVPLDVWPAPRPGRMVMSTAQSHPHVAATAAMPQLLSGVVEEIVRRLHRLSSLYPQYAHLHSNTPPVFDDHGTQVPSSARGTPATSSKRLETIAAKACSAPPASETSLPLIVPQRVHIESSELDSSQSKKNPRGSVGFVLPDEEANDVLLQTDAVSIENSAIISPILRSGDAIDILPRQQETDCAANAFSAKQTSISFSTNMRGDTQVVATKSQQQSSIQQLPPVRRVMLPSKAGPNMTPTKFNILMQQRSASDNAAKRSSCTNEAGINRGTKARADARHLIASTGTVMSPLTSVASMSPTASVAVSSPTFPSPSTAVQRSVVVPFVGRHAASAAADTSLRPLQRRKSQLNTEFRSSEDKYREDRVRIFEAAGRDVSQHFQTYRNLFLWIFSEFADYELYCRKNAVSPQMRDQFEADLREELMADFADERARLVFERDQLQMAYDELSAKYQKSKHTSQTAERRIAEKDRQLQEKDAELAENAEGRAGMLARIHRLEKELWTQRDALEGPEMIINGLRKEVKSLDERLKFTAKALDEANMDKTVLKVRLERLEDMLKDRKVRQAQLVPKSELLLYKKGQIEILELNATLEAKLIKMRSAYRNLMDELQRVKSGVPGTPRPPWHLADDLFPAASTTAQRVHLAMREYRQMLQHNQTLQKEVADLRKVVTLLPRTEENERSEYILPEMSLKYFYKKGFDASVPTYLRGNGRAANLNLTLEQTGGYCRLLFLHRDTVKFTTTLESLVESFCMKNAPPNTSGQDFAYSLVHAMRWYSFDPFIGLMREYVNGEVDDTLLSRIEKIVCGCKLFIQNAAEELGLGGGGGGAAGKTTSTAAHQPNAELEDKGESIRRKSIMNLTNAAESEKAAAKALNNVPFSAQCLATEEPRLLYKTEILPLMTDYFCTKSEESIKALVGQMNMDYPGIQVDSRALFRFVASKKRFTAFVEEIIRQELQHHRDMVADYTAAIQSTTNTDGHVSPQDVAEVLWKLDPLIPGASMDELLSDLFEVSIDDLHPRIVEGSFFRTPGLEGERVYEENAEDPLVAEEMNVVARVKRRYLQRFCPKEEAEVELLRMQKEAERAKERAELDD